MSATDFDTDPASDNTLQSFNSTSATTPQVSPSKDGSIYQETQPAEEEQGQDHNVSTTWRIHHPDFKQILGDSPRIDLLFEQSYAFAHEAGVYFRATDEVFITSNRLVDAVTKAQSVEISKIGLATFRQVQRQEHNSGPNTLPNSLGVHREIIPNGLIHMANGGVNYGLADDEMLFCAQGSRSSPSGLYIMSRKPPYKTRPLLTSYHGTPFNSVNDVVVSKVDGTVWFTDPPYAAEQGYKDAPMLPPQVYCYDPRNGGHIRAVADGFGHPNGLCFSPDESTLYVTDTDKQHGSGDVRCDRPASIYAFDVIPRHHTRLLANRRLFAFVEEGIPDGIKCDTMGRVYSGCGDGIHVWSPGGVLLGRILLGGGVANFCFGQPGEIFALNETHIWRVGLEPTLNGALLADLQDEDLGTGQSTAQLLLRRAGVAKHEKSLHRRQKTGFLQRLVGIFRIGWNR